MRQESPQRQVGRSSVWILKNIQKITRALAKAGIHEIEQNNPVLSMIRDQTTGDLKPELMGERVLSAIIEIQVKRDRLCHVPRTIKKAARKVESVFSPDIYTQLEPEEPELKVPQKVLEDIESEGFSWMPNAKINMGLGRAWEQENAVTHSLHREGTLDSLERDQCLFIYPARGFNYDGTGPKVRHLKELVYFVGPSNMIVTTLRRNLYSGVSPEGVLGSIKDGARVFCTFNSREKLKEALIRIKEADEGISIVVSGLNRPGTGNSH